MPHISNTPESLLPRSDSRNPATTCRGITTQGRPCRRALASPQPSSTSVPRKSGPRQEAIDQASLYCWQHRDQDNSSNPNSTDTTASGKPRTSIDTLMDRLGVLEINDDPASKPNRRRRTNQNGYSRPKKKSTFCCFTLVEDSDDDRPVPAQKPLSYRPQSGMSQTPNGKVSRPTSTIRPQNAPVTSRPSAHKTKSWVPPALSPETTSILLAELEKPISEADLDGYIYMFWVTPPTTTNTRSIDGPDTRDIASSLLPQAEAPENSKGLRPPPQSRSISEAIRAAQDLNALTSNPTSTKPGTLRLKIGRTSNVHRRMAEWTRQCSYDLTLIRYYPYTHVSGSSSPARVPSNHGNGKSQSLTHMVPGRKVPHVHRVERLIHLELEALRVTDLGQCPECGKEHREWFEVEAAKESLRSVDECIRRWISWAESVKR
jgi:ribosomal protein L32